MAASLPLLIDAEVALRKGQPDVGDVHTDKPLGSKKKCRHKGECKCVKKSARDLLQPRFNKHYGPGPHASGSPQEVHGSGGGGSSSSWFHSSNSSSFPNDGPVHVGTKGAAEYRGDGRPHLHEVEFIGEAYNTPSTPTHDYIANYAYHPELYDLTWEIMEESIENGLFTYEEFTAVYEAVQEGKGVYYDNEVEGGISLVADAKDFRVRTQKHYGPGPHKNGSPQSVHSGQRPTWEPDYQEAKEKLAKDPSVASDVKEWAINRINQLRSKGVDKVTGEEVHALNRLFYMAHNAAFALAKHMGPGPHPSGSEQSVHGSGRGSSGPSRKDIQTSLSEDGGFTVDPKSPIRPSSGFMVSLAEFEQTYDGSPSVAQIGQYRAANWSRFSEIENAHWGGWYDSSSDKTYFDVSIHVTDLDEAVRLGREWKQLAIFHLDTFTEIRLDDDGSSLSDFQANLEAA